MQSYNLIKLFIPYFKNFCVHFMVATNAKVTMCDSKFISGFTEHGCVRFYHCKVSFQLWKTC